jgi:Rrf2 family protein
MLTQRGKYALRAVLYLAGQWGRGPVLIQEIAEHEHIPKKFLEMILRELRNEGFLQSKMGKGGGYQMAVPPHRVTVGEVIRTIDGPLAPIPCASQTAFVACADCPEGEACLIRLVMRDVRDATARILDGATFQSLVDRRRALETAGGEVLYFEI